MSEPKVLGSRVLMVEIFFATKTNAAFRDLMQGQKELFQKQKIRIDVKRTADEYTTRLGHVVGPIVDRENIGWHEETTKILVKIDVGEVELKKDVMWEGDERHWCMVAHSAYTERDIVDGVTRQLKLSKKVMLNTCYLLIA